MQAVAKHFGVLAALLALGLAGCAGNATRDALFAQSAGGAFDESNLIIVAVENDTPASPPRPASTRPGYAGMAYQASEQRPRDDARAWRANTGLPK